jgi:hypothetical protein
MKKRLMLTTFIDDYVSAEETEPVAVVIAGSDAWSVEKSEQLIRAARALYTSLNEVSQFLHNCPNDGTDQPFNEMLFNMERAIAAACGAVVKTEQRSVDEKAK